MFAGAAAAAAANAAVAADKEADFGANFPLPRLFLVKAESASSGGGRRKAALEEEPLGSGRVEGAVADGRCSEAGDDALEEEEAAEEAAETPSTEVVEVKV